MNTTTWPTHTGPRHDLHRLGMTSDPARSLPWERLTSITQPDNSTLCYRTKAKYLNSRAIQQLAALTFEGYEIYVHSRQDGLQINIETNLSLT